MHFGRKEIADEEPLLTKAGQKRYRWQITKRRGRRRKAKTSEFGKTKELS